MRWIVAEAIDDARACLIALRLADGARRMLFESPQTTPLRAALHPELRRIAVDVSARNAVRGEARSRVALLNLDKQGRNWLHQSLDPRWRIGGATFADTGRRLALEGAYDGAPFAEIYVYDLALSRVATTEKLLAGVRNPLGLACARPVFLPGGDQLVYLRQTRADGGWGLALLDLTRPGAADTRPGDRAPSAFTEPLADRLDIVPEGGLVPMPKRRSVLCVGRVRGGARQQLHAAPLSGAEPVPLGHSHNRIGAVATTPDGRQVAYVADGGVFVVDLDRGETHEAVTRDAALSPTGLLISPDGALLWMAVQGPDRTLINAVSLAAPQPVTVADLGDVTVVALHAVPDAPEIIARLDAQAADEQAAPTDAPEGATAVTALPDGEGGDTAVVRIDGPGETEDATVDGPLMATSVHTAPEAAPPVPTVVSATPRKPRQARSSVVLAPPSELDPGEDEHTMLDAAPTVSSITELGDSALMEAEDDVEELEADSVDASQGSSVPDGADLPDPRADFSMFMAAVGQAADPAQALASLARFAGDAKLGEAAARSLEATITLAESDPGATTMLIFAVTAAGQLRARAARPALRRLCQRAHDRLDEHGALPEVEEHFALAALKAIADAQVRFAAMPIFEEYESILTQLADLRGAEGERQKAFFVQRYAAGLAEVLVTTAAEDAEAVAREARALAARQKVAAERAAAERAAAERAAAERAEAQRVAEREFAARKAAAEVAARLAERASIAQETEEWNRLRARAAAGQPPAAETDWGAARARAEAQARADAEARAAEQAEWARIRAQAEARARAEAEDEQTDFDESAEWARMRAQAEDRARESAVDEQAEWARIRAEAEARARADAQAEARAQAQAEARARIEATARAEAEARAQAEARAREQAEWNRIRAEAAAREAAERAAAEREYAERRAAAERAAVEREYAERRAAAERAAAEQNARLAAGQRAAEIEARRRAEAAHRGPPSMAQPSAEERFNPLATGSALPIVRPTRAARPAPAAPVQSRQSIDSYANRSAEFAGRSAEFENSGMWSESAIHRIQPSAPPKALPVIGLAAAAAGIILAVLGAKLGGLFVPCGLLWIAGGLTLLGDKRWSWLFALASYWVNAAFLVVYGLAGNPPEWLPGSVLMLFGIIAGGVGGALLHPMFMQRYRKDRPRF